ncbi:MAG: histidinol dehydrogenase [Spirochaetaceae bacterium]|jgi:histidinol dehydrogenase|nr:histidinol dehydrogenase [Spirochaetaceae bacterium]
MITINVGRLAESLITGGKATDNPAQEAVRAIIGRVRKDGAAALREYSLQFDHVAIEQFEVAAPVIEAAHERLRQEEPALFDALCFAADNIRAFAEFQKTQISSVEREAVPGMFTGQRAIPLDRAAVYVPRGRYPLISTALMGVIPAVVAGVREIYVTSAPLADGLPDWRIMAAASLAGAHRIFALGGAHAVAAFAFGVSASGGTSGMAGNGEIIPRADIIVGPGNKYVAEAKRQLFGETGIEAVAGPTDVLIIADESASPVLVAADLIAQAEHDADARARALVPDIKLAQAVKAEAQKQLETLPGRETAQASLDAGGLLIVYRTKEEAVAAANRIAPEHLELHVKDPAQWLPALANYGSVFIGETAAEALGDYSAGINHTLPTMGYSRFSGGLSVRHFLKIVTSLRCENGADIARYLETAKVIAEAEGLYGHARSLDFRLIKTKNSVAHDTPDCCGGVTA